MQLPENISFANLDKNKLFTFFNDICFVLEEHL
jgi:hypothetical protein